MDALTTGQALPQLLGEKGHHRVEQPQAAIEHCQQHLPRHRPRCCSHQRGLGQLDIPVAKLTPEEVIEPLAGLVEAKVLELLVDLGRHPGESGENPALRRRQPLDVDVLADLRLTDTRQGKACGVPDLVAKGPITGHALEIQRDVPSRAVEDGEGKTNGVGPILIHDLERIDGVAAGLGHLLSLGVPDQTGEMDRVEGQLIGEMEAAHHHPRHPEEDDVEGRHQHVGRIEGLQILGFVRPAKGRERPQGRREPGVQHIRILGQILGTGRFDRLFQVVRDKALTVRRVPGRNLMTPPELTGDAPGLDVVQPVLPGLAPGIGNELQIALLDRLQCPLRRDRDVAEPLRGDQRLDRYPAALTVPDIVGIGLDLDQVSLVLEHGHDLLTGLESIQPDKLLPRLPRHPALAVDDLNPRQVVTLADIEVGRIVERCDFDHAGAELAVDHLIGDKGELASHQREDGEPALELPKPLVFGMDRDGGIPQHGLRPSRGHHDALFAAINGVGNVVELALNRLHLHFQIGDRGFEARRPVDDVLVPGNEPLPILADKGLAHRA